MRMPAIKATMGWKWISVIIFSFLKEIGKKSSPDYPGLQGPASPLPGPGLKIRSAASFVKPGRPGNKGWAAPGGTLPREFPIWLFPEVSFGYPAWWRAPKKSPVRRRRTGDYIGNPSRWGLTGEPAVVAHREEGVWLDPVEEEEGKVGVEDTVNEFHIPFLMDVVVHPYQGDNPQPGEEFHHDDGVDEKRKQQHPQKEVGERELDLGDEEVDNGQKPVLFPVVAKDKLELHPVFPEIAAVPTQIHAAQAPVSFRDHGVNQGAAL